MDAPIWPQWVKGAFHIEILYEIHMRIKYLKSHSFWIHIEYLISLDADWHIKWITLSTQSRQSVHSRCGFLIWISRGVCLSLISNKNYTTVCFKWLFSVYSQYLNIVQLCKRVALTTVLQEQLIMDNHKLVLLAALSDSLDFLSESAQQ